MALPVENGTKRSDVVALYLSCVKNAGDRTTGDLEGITVL